MGLRPLEMFNSLSAVIDFRRLNSTPLQRITALHYTLKYITGLRVHILAKATMANISMITAFLSRLRARTTDNVTPLKLDFLSVSICNILQVFEIVCKVLNLTQTFITINTQSLFLLYFSSFEAGIADSISSFKWRKQIIFFENIHLLNSED